MKIEITNQGSDAIEVGEISKESALELGLAICPDDVIRIHNMAPEGVVGTLTVKDLVNTYA